MIKKFLTKRKEKKRFEGNYKIIKESGLFDVDYYFENYPDVKAAGIDPIEHYISCGWKEGRNPNDCFDTFYYLKRYTDVSQSSINPLVHYILHGKREDREIFPIECKEDKLENLFVDYREHSPIKSDLKLIAFYLPQFHPFPENDEWWGKGFTEWTNVTKATPNFEGHYQPHLPIHNGFYDLRVPEVMIEQAKLARNYGIYGFNFYYYWFNGKILMHRPFEILLEHKEIDINFCITWANENWTRKWDGLENDILIKQEYSEEDAIAFINHLFKFFKDKRYIRINNKPVLMIYRANDIPDVEKICKLWRKEAKNNGFDDLYLVCSTAFLNTSNPKEIGFDAGYDFPPLLPHFQFYPSRNLNVNEEFLGQIYDYGRTVEHCVKEENRHFKIFNTVMLSWDNTARKQNNSVVFHNFKLESYKNWLFYVCKNILNNQTFSSEEKIVLINAWNEWAEGTHLEPDRKYGYGYLEATYDVLSKM
ncbi:TPA: glycoside hydrolase family 99-like domain-containing protein [Campylobacter coli]|nr:glycoside hydrolase family 99-like domain-containing protein [Campylobacter coli]HEB9323451.1 glycoside hydrolase family 99-like domain-containing protein [Campylobacter coli]